MFRTFRTDRRQTTDVG